MSVAAVAVGAGVVGSVIQAGAASDAADAQAAGTAASIDEQRRQYDTTRADNLPAMQRGNQAGNRLQYMLGLGGGDGSGGGNVLTRNQIRDELMGSFTTPAKAGWIHSGTTDVNGWPVYLNTTTGEKEARPDHLNNTLDMLGVARRDNGASPERIDSTGLEAAIEKRWQEQQARVAAGEAAAQSDPNYGSLLRKFGQSDLDNDLVYQNGLQFGLDEGRKGINQLAAASGGFQSGKTLKALSRFGNDYATTKTAGAFDRFTNTQDRTYNKLAGVAGSGQVATNQVSAAGQNMANNVSNAQIGMGNARGASAIAQGNAWGGALNSVGNALQRNSLGAYNPYSDPTYGTGGNYGGYNAAANGGWGIE